MWNLGSDSMYTQIAIHQNWSLCGCQRSMKFSNLKGIDQGFASVTNLRAFLMNIFAPN